MPERIYLSPPDVGTLEESYVVAALRSGWVAPLGPEVDSFEREIANRIGVSDAVALSSGTAGLHLGLLALGVGPGDLVVTATMTFVATANAIMYTGAEPYFVDSDPETGNMSPDLLDEALRLLAAEGKCARAIVPVDLFGKCADYTAIESIAARYGIPVLADSAESLGASHRGRAAGSFGRASVFSFNGNKIITTSGGGMLVTNDVQLATRIRHLATQARQPAIHYEHAEVGYNYRMSNLLAALGRAQLSRLDEMITKRRAARERYQKLLEDVSGVEVFGADDGDDNCWLTTVLVDSTVTGWTATDLGASLAAADIESRPLWKPMHMQPVYANARGSITGVSESLFERGLVLPSGSALTSEQIGRVDRCITEFTETRRR